MKQGTLSSCGSLKRGDGGGLPKERGKGGLVSELVVEQRIALERMGASDVQHMWTEGMEQSATELCPLCTC